MSLCFLVITFHSFHFLLNISFYFLSTQILSCLLESSPIPILLWNFLTNPAFQLELRAQQGLYFFFQRWKSGHLEVVFGLSLQEEEKFTFVGRVFIWRKHSNMHFDDAEIKPKCYSGVGALGAISSQATLHKDVNIWLYHGVTSSMH